MGVDVEARLVRPGFHPAGGGLHRGRDRAAARAPQPLELCSRGPAGEPRAEVLVAHLDCRRRASRSCRAGRPSRLAAEQIAVRELDGLARGPGNAIHVILPHEHVTEVVTAFGRRGLPGRGGRSSRGRRGPRLRGGLGPGGGAPRRSAARADGPDRRRPLRDRRALLAHVDQPGDARGLRAGSRRGATPSPRGTSSPSKPAAVRARRRTRPRWTGSSSCWKCWRGRGTRTAPGPGCPERGPGWRRGSPRTRRRSCPG